MAAMIFKVPPLWGQCSYRIAFGPREGQKVLTLRTLPSQAAPPTSERCVNAQGFSLHAEVRLAINQRHKLEHLCRYITRPAIANERLTLNRTGEVVLQLKSPYHDGTTHIVMSPLEFSGGRLLQRRQGGLRIAVPQVGHTLLFNEITLACQ